MDPQAMAAALPDQLPGLLRFARTLAGQGMDAEDLVQETVSRALARAGGFREDASLATWLHRILHNLVVDQARRRHEEPVEDLTEAVESRWRDDSYTVDLSVVLSRAEERADLLDALSHLPFGYRTAVVLHDAEGMSVREIADIQEVSLPAAKQRLRRGRMMLVSELAKGHERQERRPGVPMRCWEARREIGDYIDGDLDPGTARRLERHLEGCPTCPALYAGLVGTAEALRVSAERDPDTVVPPDVLDRLLGGQRHRA